MDQTSKFNQQVEPAFGVGPTNPDFCYGAKDIFSLLPVDLNEENILGSVDLPDLNFDFDNFDTFNDVFMSEKDELLQNLTQDQSMTVFDNKFSTQNQPSEFLKLSPAYETIESPSSNLFGNFSELSPQTIDTDEMFLGSSPVRETSPAPVINLHDKHNKPVTIKLKKFKSSAQKVKEDSSNITLKDAIDMENANFILDKLLEPDSETESISDAVSTDSYPSSPEPPVERSCGPIRGKKYRRRATTVNEGFHDKVTKKKEQNKSAAQRYRMKKKQEDEMLAQKLEDTLAEQKELKQTYKKLKSEVKFMKNMLREAFIIKGLIAVDAFPPKANKNPG